MRWQEIIFLVWWVCWVPCGVVVMLALGRMARRGDEPMDRALCERRQHRGGGQ